MHIHALLLPMFLWYGRFDTVSRLGDRPSFLAGAGRGLDLGVFELANPSQDDCPSSAQKSTAHKSPNHLVYRIKSGKKHKKTVRPLFGARALSQFLAGKSTGPGIVPRARSGGAASALTKGTPIRSWDFGSSFRAAGCFFIFFRLTPVCVVCFSPGFSVFTGKPQGKPKGKTKGKALHGLAFRPAGKPKGKPRPLCKTLDFDSR